MQLYQAMLVNIKKMTKIYQCWVKKRISKRDWSSWYSKNSSYCFLKKEDDNIWVGFLVADDCPDTCEPMNYTELRQVDDYRRAKNISPYPLEEVSVEKKEIPQSTLDALDKMKSKIKGVAEKMNVIQKPEKIIQHDIGCEIQHTDKCNCKDEGYEQKEREKLMEIPF